MQRVSLIVHLLNTLLDAMRRFAGGRGGGRRGRQVQDSAWQAQARARGVHSGEEGMRFLNCQSHSRSDHKILVPVKRDSLD